MALDFIYELVSATCFGISNAYWKKIERAGYDFSRAVFFRAIVGVLLLLVVFSLFRCIKSFREFTFLNLEFRKDGNWFISIGICLFCSLGIVCYVASLKQKLVAVAVSLSSINVFGILTATFVFGETFLPKHVLSLISAAFGILFISIKGFSTGGKFSFNLSGILLPILASMFWGVGYTLFKIPLQWMGAMALSILIETTVLIVALIMVLIKQPVTKSEFKTALLIKPHFYISGLLLVGGSFFVNVALSKLPVVEVNILGMFTFPVSIAAAYFINYEKPTIRETIGIIFIVASILYSLI